MTKPPLDIEPLEDELWLAAMDRLSRRQAEGGNVENLLRHAFHLLQLAPHPLRAVARCELDEESFERLLDSGAFEAAAMALAAPPAHFTLSSAAEDDRGPFRATVRFSAQSPAAEANSDSAARALLGAWTNALRQRSIADLAPRPVLHRPPA